VNITTQNPYLLVLDSGLGGLSVLRALREALPDAPLIYVADTAAFPYGNRTPQELSERATHVIEVTRRRYDIAQMVIACNTLSTLCLDTLRARIPLPIIGTVPAIKVAAQHSRTKRFTLLATPNTADSSYSRDLISKYAAGCVVDRVAALHLAVCAEQWLLEGACDPEQVRRDIVPCFHDDARGKTDMLVLGCTHYPFLAPMIEELAPWKVELIDPAPAIAKQAQRVWNSTQIHHTPNRIACVTKEADVSRYRNVFTQFGFEEVMAL
jgi:glutamate racemase